MKVYAIEPMPAKDTGYITYFALRDILNSIASSAS